MKSPAQVNTDRLNWQTPPPSPPVQFLSFLCSFHQKSCQIIGFCPKLRGCPPPRLGNPGSTTGFRFKNESAFYFYSKSPYFYYFQVPPLTLHGVTCFTMFTSESLDTVTLVVVHHVHTGPVVAAGYTKTIIYVYKETMTMITICL